MNKIRVVWIAAFSNGEVRNALDFANNTLFEKLVSGVTKTKIKGRETDACQWITNGIEEFKKFKNIELHVITYSTGLKSKIQEFHLNGIFYHVYESHYYSIGSRIKAKLLIKDKKHKADRKTIQSFIKKINPDLIHIIGAENPEYSLSALDIPKEIPLLVSLQTLMSYPGFFENYPISRTAYDYRSFCEKQVLCRANYIGSKSKIYREYIIKEISKDAQILNLGLALGIDPVIDMTIDKQFDFVYFAGDISKAFDVALESFAITKKKHPNISMNVVGNYSKEYYSQIMSRMNELGIGNSITFEGRLPSHNDVMLAIQKSRFALIPLKVDLISGTIREAMAHGLPTLSTITPATPLLNTERESILLSEMGDYQAMANNMCRLIEDADLAETLKLNGMVTIEERYSNKAFMETWHKAYYQIIENFKNQTPFTKEIM